MPENRRHFLALIGQQPGQKGRRTIYDADLHCQMVRDLAQVGKFPEAWAAEIGVTLNTLRVWVNTHEEFAEAMIIARHLLQAYWSNELAQARNHPNAKPGIYSLIVRRLPELYGRNPVDIFAFLHSPTNEDAAEVKDVTPITTDGVRTMTEADIEARLETLRRRQAAEKEE